MNIDICNYIKGLLSPDPEPQTVIPTLIDEQDFGYFPEPSNGKEYDSEEELCSSMSRSMTLELYRKKKQSVLANNRRSIKREMNKKNRDELRLRRLNFIKTTLEAEIDTLTRKIDNLEEGISETLSRVNDQDNEE